MQVVGLLFFSFQNGALIGAYPHARNYPGGGPSVLAYFFLVDGYTLTDAYPHSAAVDDMRNDIRNSVKAVMDAFDGTVDLYLADPTDPLMQTFAQSSPLNFHPNDWLIIS